MKPHKKVFIIITVAFFATTISARNLISRFANRVGRIFSGNSERRIKIVEKKQVKCLPQYGADCGFNALYNALCLAKDENWLMDKGKLDSNLAEWRNFVENSNGYSTWIGSIDMDNLINNFEILESLRGDANFFIIDNIYELEFALEEIRKETLDDGLVIYYEENFINKIKRFRSGQNLEIIFNFASDNLSNINSGSHWVAGKFEWKGDKVEIRLANSMNSDITKSGTTERVCKLIVNSELP